MDNTKLSLMTFTLDIDMVMKKMTAVECLLLAKNAGIGAVDVMDPSEARLREYQAAAEQTGVRPLCYIGTVSFFCGHADKIRNTLARQLAAAQQLGAKLYMIVPMDVRRDEKRCRKLGKEQVRDCLRRYFSMAVSMAEGTGIRVCFETTPRDYTGLSGTEDCRWILRQVPELGLVYDTANMLPHGDDPLAYYEALKDRILHVHVKDVALRPATWKDKLFHSEMAKSGEVMTCCVPGRGIIPLRQILTRMEQDGYAGTYALEYSHPPRYPADPATNAARLAEHLAFWQEDKE